MSVHEFSMRNFASDEGRSPSDALIRREQSARKYRNELFGEGLFGDPAWDLLLELYANALGQQRISLSSASCASCVPLSTALRWMVAFEERGLITRDSDPLDARRTWISLTPHGASLMHSYFLATATAASAV
jgi:DNA-binding MarR family transcriptional regulator